MIYFRDKNIKAVTINSQSKYTKQEVINMVLRDQVQLVYTTPETYKLYPNYFEKMKSSWFFKIRNICFIVFV